MTRTLTALSARRRHPLAVVVLIALALVLVGGLYAAVAPRPAEASTATADADDLQAGKELFLANCATCHGLDAQGGEIVDGSGAGPSLIGVGAASVDFQVGTGRMPLQMSSAQAPEVPKIRFSQEQIDQMAAYIASLAPGPAIPGEDVLDMSDVTAQDVSRGAQIFRTNCAMCHNFAGKGGALTGGKYAPDLTGVEGKYIYEAMVTGPQSMPVFPNSTISPEDKTAIIAWLTQEEEFRPEPGGLPLGSLGPVSEGLLAWIAGIGLLVGCSVWLGMKSS
ncbi:cytochrome c [Paenibacillus sp. TRM 82003]|uniref:cytochrome bc1 complex diheme cytochrome c subunit n=1 Tax=Kineococcus sp. TRM81007 TaxID=2925831 RepID=UPI001F59DF90|nr:cytochrome c [Kineococcus sp. TRM81007]MCI2239658.1 cytochrome c [Kineococcus sp. TRM81007]MCI3926778.1 cytochrome c [Paenibacillus sp. TRM 82003]